MKIGRNSPCPCGSGKKYKFCCLGKVPEYMAAKRCLYELQRLGLDPEQKTVRDIFSRLNDCLQTGRIPENDRESLVVNAFQYYVMVGQDKDGLQLLDSVEIAKMDQLTRIALLTLKLRALMNLARVDDALELCPDLHSQADALKWENPNAASAQSGALIEIGRTYSLLEFDLRRRTQEYPQLLSLREYQDTMEDFRECAMECYRQLIDAYESHHQFPRFRTP